MDKPTFNTIKKPIFVLSFSASAILGTAIEYANIETYIKEEGQRLPKTVAQRPQDHQEEKTFYFMQAQNADLEQDSKDRKYQVYAEASDLEGTMLLRFHFPGLPTDTITWGA